MAAQSAVCGGGGSAPAALPLARRGSAQSELLRRKLNTGSEEVVAPEHVVLQAVREPERQALLATLHALEAYRPEAMGAAYDVLLCLRSVLMASLLALNAATVWVGGCEAAPIAN